MRHAKFLIGFISLFGLGCSSDEPATDLQGTATQDFEVAQIKEQFIDTRIVLTDDILGTSRNTNHEVLSYGWHCYEHSAKEDERQVKEVAYTLLNRESPPTSPTTRYVERKESAADSDRQVKRFYRSSDTLLIGYPAVMPTGETIVREYLKTTGNRLLIERVLSAINGHRMDPDAPYERAYSTTGIALAYLYCDELQASAAQVDIPDTLADPSRWTGDVSDSGILSLSDRSQATFMGAASVNFTLTMRFSKLPLAADKAFRIDGPGGTRFFSMYRNGNYADSISINGRAIPYSQLLDQDITVTATSDEITVQVADMMTYSVTRHRSDKGYLRFSADCSNESFQIDTMSYRSLD